MLHRARLTGPAGPLLGVAVGLLAAGLVTVLQEPVYRADASIVLVRQGQPPGSDPRLARATTAAAELFASRAVADSAIRNLGLDVSPRELLERVDVEAQAGSSLLRIDVRAPSREEARRTAQELAEVATVLFNDRFAPQAAASIWEPASAEQERVSPQPARNLALGALLGALAGLALVLASLRGRAPALPRRQRPEPKPRPRERPQPPPAVREERRSPPEPFRRPLFGEWTIGDVERLLSEQGSDFPELREELELYLDSLRGVAAADGWLPGEVGLVVEDVFAPLLARAGGSGGQGMRPIR